MNAPTASITPPSAAPSITARPFEAVWTALERRHAWRISIDRIDSRKAAIAKLPYAWADMDNRRAAAFRARHRLDDVVAGSADDWQALLRLRNWAFFCIRNGDPSFGIEDLTTAVDASLSGATFWCTFYAYTFVAAATSMGYTARHLGIDSDRADGAPGTHHGVCDVWVDSLRKWVVLDPHYDSHHELDGVPLNAEEIGRRWHTHRGAGIRTFIGPDRREVPRVRRMEIEARGYFWHYIDADNDVFHRRFHANPVIFPVDEARKSRVWYQGPVDSPQRHQRYGDGTFMATERIADAYPELNCVELDLQPLGRVPYCTPIRLWTSAAPNFSHHAIRLDGGESIRFDGMEFPWRLTPGSRSIDVRVVNRAGHEGPPARLAVRIEDDPSRAAEWSP
jgi:hypothetical protein